MPLIAALFQPQRRAIINFEISSANHGFSYGSRVQPSPKDDDLIET